MTAPTLTRTRRPQPAEPETLPAAVRDLLDKAVQWPEYEGYFLAEAERLLGRPISRTER